MMSQYFLALQQALAGHTVCLEHCMTPHSTAGNTLHVSLFRVVICGVYGVNSWGAEHSGHALQ